MVDQLMNQNPLDPTDTDSYLDKLVSYASYDTQTSISEDLGSVVDTISSSLSSLGIGYVGMTVSASGSTTALQDGSADWTYTLDSTAEDVTINVLNESGKVVYSETGNAASGTHDFSWDGVGSDGEQLDDGGLYTLSVDATNSAGKDVTGSTTVSGLVTGVDFSDGETVLNIGKAAISIDKVLSVLSS